MQTYKNFIDGQWVESSSGKTFTSSNPASEEVIGKFQASTAKDVELAVNAAVRAFPSWSSTPAPVRGEILLKIARLLRQKKLLLGKLIVAEMGKVLKEARGDVQEAIDIFEYMAGEGRRLFGRTTPSELKDKMCFTVRKPFGVVGLITPWNFPIAIPAWKCAPALITGNTIVLKPSSDTPLCAIEFVKVLHEAGLPKGVVNVVTGSGSDVGLPLVKHPKVRAVSFTGHKDTGKLLLQEAGIKKVSLELGGKNAIIVLDDADLDLAVDGILWAGFGTTGQRCTATSRVIVHQAVAKKVQEKLVARMKKLQIGSGVKKDVDVGPLINRAALEHVAKYVQIGVQEGASLVCGGAVLRGKGFFFQPTLFTKVKSSMCIAQEEIFGPVVSMIEVKDFAEAIRVCNDSEYGLSAAVYTNNIRQALLAVDQIESGITYVN
ncbi:MAG: aldehyde dehydrogenase family protein, partial [Nanoarchaeota archaeon]|nr:aldehyde dehydrogenase family protein [Nanoarchaeota archaeon]